ncbi:MAG: hypothetical protein JXM70_08470, partial [Pirellulales bacterium]|nr:hypothetical protein [Pirellulales bacterium]
SDGKDIIRNYTGIDLRGVGVLRRTEKGQLEAAWIGDIYRSASAVLKFHPIEPKPVKPPAENIANNPNGRLVPSPANTQNQTTDLGPWHEQRQAEPQTQFQQVKGEFNFSGLIRLAEQTKNLQPGDYRLIGWADTSIPGVEVEPAAPQSRSATMIVANLAYGFGNDPQPDVNARPPVDKPPVMTDESVE